MSFSKQIGSLYSDNSYLYIYTDRFIYYVQLSTFLKNRLNGLHVEYREQNRIRYYSYHSWPLFMCFQHQSRTALSLKNWHVEQATEHLLS